MVCTLSLAYFLHLPPFHWWSLTTNQHIRSLPWTTPLIDCFTSMSIPSHTHLPTINPSFEPTTMLYPQTQSFKPPHPYCLTVTMTISLATTSFHLVVPHSSLECNMHLPPPMDMLYIGSNIAVRPTFTHVCGNHSLCSPTHGCHLTLVFHVDHPLKCWANIPINMYINYLVNKSLISHHVAI